MARFLCVTAAALALGSAAMANPAPAGSELARGERIMMSTAQPDTRFYAGDTGCALANNVWNPDGVPAGFEQGVFMLRSGKAMLPGWRWNAPGTSRTVLSMPELICGDKPWDAPQNMRSGFPFRAGEKAPAITFDIDLLAEGTYNAAFSLWAVSALPATPKTISLEIMVWTLAEGQTPAGEKIGTLQSGGTVFDLYLKKDQGVVTGPDPLTWPLVQYVAQTPLLKGRIDFKPLLDDLIRRGLLTPGHWLTSIELGTEVWGGKGTLVLRQFDIALP